MTINFLAIKKRAEQLKEQIKDRFQNSKRTGTQIAGEPFCPIDLNDRARNNNFKTIKKIEQDFFITSLCYFLYNEAVRKEIDEERLIEVYPEYQKILGKPFVEWPYYFNHFSTIIRDVENDISCWLTDHEYMENKDMAPLDRFECFIFKKSNEKAMLLLAEVK